MSRIFYLLTLIFLLTGCKKYDTSLIGYNKIELKSFIIDNYTWDAKQLYFDEVFHNEKHINYHNPILDTNEINKVLRIIQAVYDSDSPERDTVFEIYQIHGYYCYGFSSIHLKVQTELPEIENLSNGIIPTGGINLDKFLSTYHFDSVKTSYSYPDFPWLTIYTNNEYNMIPIEKEAMDLVSVLIAEFSNGFIGDGNTINLIRNNSSAIITFSIGRGDCPAGCTYRKNWEFKVSDGFAKFVRTY